MDFGQSISQTIDCKSVHPVTAVPGGMKKIGFRRRDAFLQQTDDRANGSKHCNLALDVVNKY